MWWASALLAAPTISPRMRRPAPDGVLPFLEDQHGRALAHHEPVAIDVERAADPGGGQRRHVAEASQCASASPTTRPHRWPRRRSAPRRSAGRRCRWRGCWRHRRWRSSRSGPAGPSASRSPRRPRWPSSSGRGTATPGARPSSRRTSTCSSRVCSPPTPVAKIVPNRAGSTPSPPCGSPAWVNASVAAAMANCSTRSARRASFGEEYHGDGSQSAISVARPEVIPGPSRPRQ